MALVYRSSSPEQRVVIERQADGRQRVAKASKAEGSERTWDLRVEHPSGRTWSGSYTGPATQVTAALDEMLRRSEHEWVNDRSRGDRPHTEPADYSRTAGTAAPIRPSGRGSP